MAKKKAPSVNNNRIIIVVLILIIAVLILYIFFKLNKTTYYDLNQGNQTTVSKTTYYNLNQGNQMTDSKCAKLGVADKQDYLRSYTIKAGDSLIGIAKSELGSTSRINEIVELNRDQYPLIYDGYSFLEVGWKLYLPPININSSSGKLEQISGLLVNKDDTYWSISFNSRTVSIPSYKFNNVQNKDSFNVGDCVILLRDLGNEVVLHISKQ